MPSVLTSFPKFAVVVVFVVLLILHLVVEGGRVHLEWNIRNE